MATTTDTTVSETTAAAVDTGPKSYLAMMLLAFFAAPSGLARAYRGEQIGWIRFWIYIGATVTMIIPFLNILGGLALLALTIWGIVDFFMLYKVRNDAAGKELTTTPRDLKAAKALWIVFIVMLCLTGLMVILMLIFGAFIINAVMQSTGQRTDRPQLPSSSYFESSDYYR